MENRKIRQICQALSGQAQDVTLASQFQTLADLARENQIAPALALRLVQTGLAGCSKDDQTTGRPAVKIKPLVYEVCLGKACQARGARKIMAALKAEAARGKTGPDTGPVKVKSCSCQHRCGKAPIVLVNGNLHEKFPVPD